ncbi:iron-containing redox enzyme family protein [Sphingomonas sp. PB2P19]|uniref:iron-containing redox enzyme family protein n=1 Tax=Sphingomonas rhamnosi TaxID=3096156 RepID=UPI002FCB7750
MQIEDTQSIGRPRLNAELRVGGTALTLGDRHTLVARDVPQAVLERTLRRMDGATTLDRIVADEPTLPREAAEALVASLEGFGLIDDPSLPAFRSGSEVILELEELVEARCKTTIYRNLFWQTCLAATAPGDLPQRLATGMVIENWHFLFRESYFDAPVLSYVPNTAVRLLLNEFFSEEYGHDEILLRSLNHVGLSYADMQDAIPLPETMALCNALAYWAHNDPLFFFATLGLLEGQGMKEDSFIEACTRVGMDDAFVGPLRTHANINIGAGHGNLTRLIFQQIPAVAEADVRRLKAQMPLFVDLYDAFYTGVWRHYTGDAPLLRRLSEL